MLIQHRKSERGQALILIVFGLIGLIGATALAVDGGSVYSDRRHAQNAADTAVMAAGLTRIRYPDDWTKAWQAGMDRAKDNGYDNNLTTNVVNVYRCTDTGANCALPAGADPNDFVKASISSEVRTYFARVLGVPQIGNSVQALAKSVPPKPTNWYNGNALVSLMPGCQGHGWPYDPFEVAGNSISVINGSGVFVNSTCDPAFTQNGTSSTMTVNSGGICVVGGVDTTTGINPPPDGNCTAPVDTQLYQPPPVTDQTCIDTWGDGYIDSAPGGNYVAHPGLYKASFPNVSPAGTLKLLSGVYCLDGGLALSGNWTITTDLDGNGTFDGSDGANEGVMFYVPTKGVTFNGGSLVTIGAINNPTASTAIKGYLIYLPVTNTSTVKLTGGNGSHFVGTILAPGAFVTLEGANSTDSLEFECQIIGYSISLSGSGSLNINYYEGQNGKTWTNPVLKLFR